MHLVRAPIKYSQDPIKPDQTPMIYGREAQPPRDPRAAAPRLPARETPRPPIKLNNVLTEID